RPTAGSATGRTCRCSAASWARVVGSCTTGSTRGRSAPPCGATPGGLPAVGRPGSCAPRAGHGAVRSVADVAQTNLQLYNQLIARSWNIDDVARVRPAYELAARLFSGRYRCSGKPFVDHLVGTASVVADSGGRVELVLAALLHAAYEHGDFGRGRRARGDERRTAVRRVVGDEAEALVFAYSRS